MLDVIAGNRERQIEAEIAATNMTTASQCAGAIWRGKWRMPPYAASSGQLAGMAVMRLVSAVRTQR